MLVDGNRSIKTIELFSDIKIEIMKIQKFKQTRWESKIHKRHQEREHKRKRQ